MSLQRTLTSATPSLVVLTWLIAANAAFAQSSTFTLSTTGCSKKHCSQNEADTVGLSTFCPTMTSGCGGVGQRLDLYNMPNSSWPNPVNGKDDLSDGCSSNSFIVACRSHVSPFLKIFASDGHMLYNSCGGTDPTNPGSCPGTELFHSASLGTPLIGQVGSGTFANSVIDADDQSIVLFQYSVVSHAVVITPYQTLLTSAGPVPSHLNPAGLLPQGIIYTSAPSGSSTIGMVTLLFENGPVLTFNAAYIGNSSQNYGYVNGQFLGGSSTPCVDNGTVHSNCFYAGTNSACAVQLIDGSGNPQGRIYAVTNQYPVTIPMGGVTQLEQYQGRVYAINVAATGESVDWYYDFVANGIVGPSGASPMCSPSSGIVYTDYGSIDQQSQTCLTSNSPTGTCGAGILGLVDCDVTPTPAPCSVRGMTSYGYTNPLSNLAADVSPYQSGVAGADTYINANFAYDSTNQCFWVRPYATSTMSCVDDGSTAVIEAVNTAFLASNPGTTSGWTAGPISAWTDIYPESNVPMSTVPSGSPSGAGDSLAIVGEHNGTHRALLGIDTGVCGQTQACCTPSVTNVTCASTWSAQPQIFWWFNLTSNGAGQAAGQFTLLNSPSTGAPCLLAFTDYTVGTWFLSASDQVNGGCGTDSY